MTQDELADRAELTGGAFVSDLERGVRPVGFGRLVQVIEIGLGATVSEVFDGLRVHEGARSGERSATYRARSLQQLVQQLGELPDQAKRDRIIEILRALLSLAS